MLRTLLTALLATLALATACPALTNRSSKPATPATRSQPVATPAADGGKIRAMVIEVRDVIDAPVLYILRRGLKEAEENKTQVVVLNMKTPGGAAGVAMEMMEALSKFSGETITYVNDEAISAGAFISAATDEIWFAPGGVIGAAAAVNSDGQDIPETMRLKINSFFRAKIRAATEAHSYRGEVISAMIDKDYELIIDGQTLKARGELLSLTATEAMKRYGNPSEPLLGAGIAKSIEDLLQQKYGSSNFSITHLEVTWSERLAQWLSMVKPLLLGLGMLALFIEFKTPGFGFFGIAGIVLLAVVFLSSYAAGLSGYEPMIVFLIGFALVIFELIFFPGVIVPMVTGLLMMMGSLVWAMADFWPGDPISVAWTTDALVAPLVNLGIGLAIGGVLILALLRYMPKSWFWDRIELASEISGAAQIAGLDPEAAGVLGALVGRRARVTTPLRPFGQIEIDGKIYEARLPLGSAERDTAVIVRGHNDFSLDVESVDKPGGGNA
ncbi:membrane-bound serine protease (ClpP class) [Ereboglobus sp. PH5-5]|uniref:NfeD family protein n=1 Tax=unclassified Ereboglobus TaxID=2626932 RepID=UPI002406EBB0|nr:MULTISPECIES: hypothetical protein [unclassified Ereboglobus]MDF9828561.1 membrane-bound serine protease (ClpP class) [Ereboglobus sp. PH5-10]MDF9832463.1 membrane-bound serine protease (ClpP class) [Ereboglobus sp. PH5-5]